MERTFTPEELVVERAYNRELDRVNTWIAPAERAWDQQHRTEERWQEAWTRDYDRGTTPYNPRNADHREVRQDWEEEMEYRRESHVWTRLAAEGIVSKHVVEHYFEARRAFYQRDNHPETERYPHSIAAFAAEEKAQEVQERVNAEPRRVVYEQTIDKVTRWLPDAERRHDEAVQRIPFLEQDSATRARALVFRAVQEGIITDDTGWEWRHKQERGQHPQLADLAWMEARNATKVRVSGDVSLQEQRQAVEQVIYAHQRQPQTPAHLPEIGRRPEPPDRAAPAPPTQEEERGLAHRAGDYTTAWHEAAADAATKQSAPVQERLNAESRRIAYEQKIEEVTRGLAPAAQQYDEKARRIPFLEYDSAERDNGIVWQAVLAGVVSDTTAWRWENARERGQHPQLADVAWMEAQHVTQVDSAHALPLPAQRQAVEQVIYAHQRQPQTPERDQAERSPEMAARGWGQSWAEQQQERGWDQ